MNLPDEPEIALHETFTPEHRLAMLNADKIEACGSLSRTDEITDGELTCSLMCLSEPAFMEV